MRTWGLEKEADYSRDVMKRQNAPTSDLAGGDRSRPEPGVRGVGSHLSLCAPVLRK